MLIERERSILSRVARGGPLEDVLRDLILLVEEPSKGEMLGSILFLSPDGTRLLEGAAPSLPREYNEAIHGIEIGPSVGSCGTAAHSGKPVYVEDVASDPRWANFRDLALGHGLRACWSVPIRGADGAVLGTFANYYREPKSPTTRDVEAIAMVAQTAAIAIERHRRDKERERAEEQRRLLLHELNHRVKNVFALADAIVVLSARSATDPAKLAEAIRGRLQALSRAHELVRPGLSDEASRGGDASLQDVLSSLLAPYRTENDTERVVLSGPDVLIAADAITSIALVFHELSTNAAKYGALSRPHGTVFITWSLSPKDLDVVWREEGGPAASAPTKTGFGTSLTRRSVEGLGGTLSYEWPSGGLSVSMRMPVAQIMRSGA